MSDTDTDLATLAENIEFMRGVIPKEDSRAALCRVRDEIARLRRELDEERGGIARTAKDAGQIISRTRQRAEAAEARCAQLEQALREAYQREWWNGDMGRDMSDWVDEQMALAGPDPVEEITTVVMLGRMLDGLGAPADSKPECSLCHVPKATGDCQHIIANGDQVTMSRKAWERFTDELAESRNSQHKWGPDHPSYDEMGQ